MKNMKRFMRYIWTGWSPAPHGIIVLAIFLLALTACNKKAEMNSLDPTSAGQNSLKSLSISSPMLGNIQQINLVSDASGLGAMRTDPNLVNAWGIAMAPREAIWISSNGKGLSVIYGEDGSQLHQAIDIPLRGTNFGSAPSGVVYDGTGEIVLPDATRRPVKFLFATEDGIIAASNGDTAITVVDRGGVGAVYKGIATGRSNGQSYIYAADFHNNRVDVFDQSYKLVSMTLSDPKIPSAFAPFNIKNIDGKLFVTYAMQDAAKHDDQAGAGNGFIDVYNTDGTLSMRFASEGTLNSPWGIVETETEGRPEHVLVGNFGDGRINVFDMQGNYAGQLANGGKPLTIEGLWGLAFDQDAEKEFEHESTGRLYFTAGPGKESHGLFGYLSGRKGNPVPEPVVKAQQITVPTTWHVTPR
jgi:uncharacterized protein (TIGR03118 family)